MIWDSTVLFNPKITCSVGVLRTLVISGSLLINTTNIQWEYYGTISFETNSLNNKVKAPLYLYNVSFSSSAGTGYWELMDSLRCGVIKYDGGIFNTKNYDIRTTSISSANSNFSTSLLLGTSTVKVLYSIDFYNPIFVDADSSIIYCNELIDYTGGNLYNELHLTSSYQPYSSCRSNTNIFMKLYTDTVLTYITGNDNIYQRLEGNGKLYFSDFLSQVAGQVKFCKVNKDLTTDQNIIFDTLFLNNPGSVVQLKAGLTQQINGAILTQNNSPCSDYITICSDHAGTIATISKANGTVNCSHLILRDIMATGGATFIAGNSISSNSSGWIINAPTTKNLYWVGGSGNWDDPNHWSSLSGGAPIGCIPSSIDNVFFDQNSFTANNQKVWFNKSQISCSNFSISNLAYTGIAFSDSMQVQNKLTVNGSFNITGSIKWNFKGGIYFGSISAGNSINSSVALQKIFFIGTGEYNLMDSVRCQAIVHNSGKLTTNGHLVRCTSYSYDNSVQSNRELDFRKSTMIIHQFNIAGNTTIHADSSTIFTQYIEVPNGNFNKIYLDSFPDVSLFYHGINAQGNGGSVSFDSIIINLDVDIYIPYQIINMNYVECNKNVHTGSYSLFHINKIVVDRNLFINSDINIDTLTLNNPGYNLSIIQNATLTINGTVFCPLNCSNGYTHINGYDPNGYLHTSFPPIANIKKTTGTLILNNVILEDINAIGPGTFIANTSFVIDSVAGILVQNSSSRNLYWVGGSGNWNDKSHWSLTDGGTGGECIPSSTDNVTINDNSINISDSISLDKCYSYCKNISFSLSPQKKVIFKNGLMPIVSNISDVGSFYITGEVILDSSVTWNYDGRIIFNGDGKNKVINPAGNDFQGEVYFNNNKSSWLLGGDIKINKGAYLLKGCLNTKNFNMFVFPYMNIAMDSVFFGSSHVTVLANGLYSTTGYWDADSTYFEVNGITIDGKDTIYSISGLMNANPILSTSANISNCKIKNFTANELYGTFSNSSVNKLIAYSNATIFGQGNLFKHADYRGDISISGTNTYDTILFNNPGKQVILSSLDTQKVNNIIQFNSGANTPISIRSSVPGSQAYILKTADTICTDYLNIKDINATGGAKFYAGTYSVDQGNNSGWSYTPCSLPYSNVWPGDANYDLIVDMYDVLNVSLAYNEIGYIRPGADITYSAQSCLDWNRTFGNLVNIKQADCDGNGKIDSLDLLAISANYGQSHPFKTGEYYSAPPAIAANGYDLSLSPFQINYTCGDSVSIPIELGNTGNPVPAIYGIAYRLNYDNSFILPGSISVNYNNSWFTKGSNRVHFEKDFYSNNHIDLGLTRRDLTNASGQGIIATIKFKLKNNVSGKLPLKLFDIKAVLSDESIVPVVGSIDTLYISNPNGIENYEQRENLIAIYPSPASNNITISKNSGIIIRKISFYGLTGNIVKEIVPTNSEQEIQLNISDLTNGVYYVRVQTNLGLKTFKLIKI